MIYPNFGAPRLTLALKGKSSDEAPATAFLRGQRSVSRVSTGARTPGKSPSARQCIAECGGERRRSGETVGKYRHPASFRRFVVIRGFRSHRALRPPTARLLPTTLGRRDIGFS